MVSRVHLLILSGAVKQLITQKGSSLNKVCHWNDICSQTQTTAKSHSSSWKTHTCGCSVNKRQSDFCCDGLQQTHTNTQIRLEFLVSPPPPKQVLIKAAELPSVSRLLSLCSTWLHSWILIWRKRNWLPPDHPLLSSKIKHVDVQGVTRAPSFTFVPCFTSLCLLCRINKQSM